MHLLVTQPGTIPADSEPVDLGQSPADIVVLTAADGEIAALSRAHRSLAAEHGRFPSLRLANLLRLSHHMSVDVYVERVVRRARLVVVRLLGGRGYWPYGVEQIAAAAQTYGVRTAFVPGDDRPDPDLAAASSVPPEDAHALWQFLVHGGGANAAGFLAKAASLLGEDVTAPEPAPILRAGIFREGRVHATLADWQRRWSPGAPVAAIVFYRALVQAADTAAVEALIEALAARGLNPLPLYVASLKDRLAAAIVRPLLAEAAPDVIVNLTGFALAPADDPLAAADCPVLQAVLSGGTEAAWREGTRGLSPRDIAMSVALPELDGRVFTRAIAFKDMIGRDDSCETDIVGLVPVADRVGFVADLAAAWARLRRKQRGERRIALVLANYPNRDSRIGNGVGLDTPASVAIAVSALRDAGYRVLDAPADGAALIERLTAGPTNNVQALQARLSEERLSLVDYTAFFGSLPEGLRRKVSERWGPPDRDPFYRPGELDCGTFRIPVARFGNIAIGVQPARGYNIDPSASYHDPDLPPPHFYLAFYAWLRDAFRADAVVHFGKHGNLEWLPGKGLALSADCFPEAALGPLPHLYPFIVNDPGEGTQAKRRAAAVIVDHLTPPLTRAGSYGPAAALERLIDEYYEAAGIDPRRLKVLAEEIQELAASSGLGRDCGLSGAERPDDALKKLDAWLCELKDLQIRDGLHVFGRSPGEPLLSELLAAIARSPRGDGQGANASLTRALAADLKLGVDPLDHDSAAAWTGPRPAVLGDGAGWRSTGDTVERLEDLAVALIARRAGPEPQWTQTRAVLEWVAQGLRPAIEASGVCEIAGLLAGLDARRVAPGASGAPTRGRPDVLPTGRNFYSVDTRAVPTPAAWHLGWKSACLLIERYAQDHGDYPKTMAISAWGTSAMRTGGDDIAQALALIGARPTWDQSSRRVTGFEILPLSVLDRPRVDVTLRISGFFRDAFPGLIDLFDSAARAVAALDEPPEQNPLAARVQSDAAGLRASGISADAAARQAGARVFGSKPGAYGAGLQALIDERGWRDRGDLARAYLAWGGYVYGAGKEGEAAQPLFETRLKAIQAVVQNQDNREHDLLDSDDYYQFEGGLTAAVAHLSGAEPTTYHNDHSQPEHPRIRTLDEEVARIVRGRVVNPKWIAGAMRHGYKGAFEIAATVDYLFAFAATTTAVRHDHFDAVFDAYVADATVREFLAEANPGALRDVCERLIEAQDRNLWRPRLNSAHRMLTDIAGIGKPT
ncbi:MAG TPA: cobaltochelatase subunit CobN [Alphaproteobacteria bacterium]